MGGRGGREGRRGRRRFCLAESGAMAMEFVVIFPILLFMLLGSFVFFDAFRSNSLAAKVAYAVNDIMSRHEDVDDVDMAYLFALQQKMMQGNVDRLTLRISSICFKDGAYKVLWSYTARDEGVPEPAQLTDATVPLALMPTIPATDSVILTEIGGRWQPAFTYAGMTERPWNNALVVRPRFVRIIPHETLNPSNVCA